MKFLTAFLTAVLFTAPALAQGRRAEKPSGQRGSRGEALQAHLQLNEQQKEALRANRQALRKETRSLAEQIREKRNQIREQMRSETPNADTIGKLNVEMRELADQVKAAREASRAEAVALLDENQQASLEELEQALALQQIARQAVGANLLAAPERGFVRRGFGRSPRGPRSGGNRRGARIGTRPGAQARRGPA